MSFRPALLEQWYRDHLRPGVVDISASGVPAMTLARLRELAGVSTEEIDSFPLEDGHTLGTALLREAVASAWGDGDPGRVLIAQGSNEVISLLMRSLFRSGDEVVLLSPLYHAYESALADVGCRIVRWRLRSSEGFEPDLQELRTLLRSRPRGVVVNLPHNPTGVSVSATQQLEIIDAVREAGAELIWDNAFADLTYGAAVLPDVSTLYHRGFSVGTLSKAFGLPGLRIGWCLGPPEVLAGTFGVRDATTLFCSPLNEFLAARAVLARDRLLAHYDRLVADGRARLLAWLSRADVVGGYSTPAGGVTSFVCFNGISDATALCEALSRAGVLVVPGQAFGHPQHVRIGFAVPAADLDFGLQAVARLAVAHREGSHPAPLRSLP